MYFFKIFIQLSMAFYIYAIRFFCLQLQNSGA